MSRGVPVFVTDDAVGTNEEENLYHLTANLAEHESRRFVCPFLTTKHSLEYCSLFAQRAAESGFGALTVLGGDRSVGPPRCVPHAYLLREHLRSVVPGLPLGGWANPHRDAVEQASYLAMPNAHADFALLQVTGSGDGPRLGALRRALDEAGVRVPVVAGVFHFRSANPKTLNRLERFIPLDRKGVEAHFASGGTAEQLTAAAVRAAWDAGFPGVYVSNLPAAEAPALLTCIGALAERLTPARPRAS